MAVAAGAGYGAQPERQEQEPDAFNRHIDEFFQAVELGKWPTRDPRAMASSILGR